MEKSVSKLSVSCAGTAKAACDSSRDASSIESWERVAIAAAFSAAEMAACCCISLRQLERVFKDQFRTTPKCWARRLRCSLAKELLAKGWTNKAVAQELRFHDASHLCHEFRLQYGATPRDFAPSLNTSRRENCNCPGQLLLQLHP